MPADQVLEPFALSLTTYITVFVLGTLFGSFANVCIYRWPPSDEHPDGRSVVKPGSHCGACGHPVRWYDNIPLVSYLLLRGRCRDCGAEFSARYLLVEALTGVLFLAAYYYIVAVAFAGDPLSFRMLRFLIVAALLFVLVVIAFIDLDHKLILDRVTFPAIPIFYGLGLLLPERTWYDGLVGAAVGYGVIRAVSDGYYWLTGRHGLGYGDGKLLAIIGALAGWKAVIAALFIGSCLGSVIGVTALVVIRRRASGDGDEPGDAPAEGAGGDAAEEAGGDAAEEAGGDAAEGAGGDAAEEADGYAADGGECAEQQVSIRHVALPFGPFLAAGAVIYIFAEPWLQIGLVSFWRSYPSVL